LLQSLLVWQGWTPHGNRDTRIHTSARKGQIMNRNFLGWVTVCLCLFFDITSAHATRVEYTEVKTLSLQRHLHTTLDRHVTAYVDTRAKEWDPTYGSASSPCPPRGEWLDVTPDIAALPDVVPALIWNRHNILCRIIIHSCQQLKSGTNTELATWFR
ncbi:MAG: hypothetical protein MN733_41210, partial [Nitrososphaera sp.]|nr:hypothetical protein [Nitrososphaera sp.]